MTDLTSKQFRQTRLFNPLSVPRRQPHQMSMMEFAQSPRTWFHGSTETSIKDIRENATQHPNQGFHVGTLRAAVDRIGHRDGGTKYDRVIHSGRIAVPMQNTPETRGYDQGDGWDEGDHRSYYHNEYEDKGSTSAVLRSPYDFMTHRDFVDRAVRHGGIPSGHAEHDADHNRVLRTTAIDVVPTPEISERHEARSLDDGGVIPQTVNYRHDLSYQDPRTSISAKMWGPREKYTQLPFSGLNENQFTAQPPPRPLNEF